MEYFNNGVTLLLVTMCMFTNIASDGPFKCIKKEDLKCGCVFKDATDKLISISFSGIDRTDGQSYFQNEKGKSGLFKYFLNPCTGFNYPFAANDNACSDVTGCQVWVNGKYSYSLGKPGTESFGTYSPGTPFNVTYVTGHKGKMTFILTCDADVVGEVVSIDDDNLRDFYIHIRSKHVCPQPYSPQKSNDRGGLSTGSIIVIVFFVILAIYFVSGVLFMKHKRQATGKEVIPNAAFWSSLPGLIKDGFIFFGKKMKQLFQKHDYEEI